MNEEVKNFISFETNTLIKIPLFWENLLEVYVKIFSMPPWNEEIGLKEASRRIELYSRSSPLSVVVIAREEELIEEGKVSITAFGITSIYNSPRNALIRCLYQMLAYKNAERTMNASDFHNDLGRLISKFREHYRVRSLSEVGKVCVFDEFAIVPGHRSFRSLKAMTNEFIGAVIQLTESLNTPFLMWTIEGGPMDVLMKSLNQKSIFALPYVEEKKLILYAGVVRDFYGPSRNRFMFYLIFLYKSIERGLGEGDWSSFYRFVSKLIKQKK